MNRPGYLLIVFLFVCSCGGSDNDKFTGGIDSSPVLQDGIGANRGMSGNLVFVKENAPWALDLFTGEVVTVKQDPSYWGWHYENMQHDGEYSNLAKFGLTPSYGSLPGYLLGVQNCYWNPLGTCIVFFDTDFNRRSAIRLNNDFYSRPVESRDGKYIALQHNSTGNIVIFDNNTKEIVRDKQIDFEGIGQVEMAWRTDGTLAYTKYQSNLPRMYVIDPTDPSEDGYYDLDLPEGTLESVRFSADGKKTMVHQRLPFFGSVIYVASDGIFTRVAMDGDSNDSYISSPEISPDGKWITMLVGHSDLPVLEGTNNGYLVAVPTDAVDVRIEGSDFVEQPEPGFRITENSSAVFSETTLAPLVADKWFGDDMVFWAP